MATPLELIDPNKIREYAEHLLRLINEKDTEIKNLREDYEKRLEDLHEKHKNDLRQRSVVNPTQPDSDVRNQNHRVRDLERQFKNSMRSFTWSIAAVSSRKSPPPYSA
jgi:hypothetical protein